MPEIVAAKVCNILPRVKILSPDLPDNPISCLPPEFMVEWEGEDPDGDDAMLEYKYILLVVDGISPGWDELPPYSHEGSGGGHAPPHVGMWSEWVPADCTYVADLDVGLVPQSPGAFKCIFVTARDIDGGVLPPDLFSSYNQNQNWFSFNTVMVSGGVELIIWGEGLGQRSNRRPDEYLSEVSAAMPGQEVRFKFYAPENRTRCEIASAYRYYYDDPADPAASEWNQWVPIDPIRRGGSAQEWLVLFPADGSSIVPEPGMHRFVAEVKDACGVISHCDLQFEVLSCSRPRGVCLIDDDRASWLEPWWGDYEEMQDSMWEDILDGYDRQEFDTGFEYESAVPAELVCGSSTVIWVVDWDIENPRTGMLQVCAGNVGNYLRSHVRNGGNLIVIGRDPVYAAGYWPDGTPDPGRRGAYSAWDFRPKWNSVLEDTLHHWMCEIFGISAMHAADPPAPFTALWPCEDCHPAFNDTIELGPQASRIGEEFANAVYITRLWEGIEVTPLYGTALRQGDDWVDSGSDRLIAVYAPAQGKRGHAAYIGVAEYWLDHAKMKTMLRRLLELFGETP
jgi:hypothetical protein